ncbi:uncharacterized protein LOC9637588 [Selaginella moellendorffii]|nr:uncharacterized protein LOC9637588 [Selaginella moellendorffii]|eukprot:XP_002988390.2 uncharacterized protein LOC9637588 [Selaginella moellendorffii]
MRARGRIWRFYASQAGMAPHRSKDPVPVLGPPALGKQKILDLLKFRPIDFAEIQKSLRENAEEAAKVKIGENKVEFSGRSLLGTLSRDAGIIKDGMRVSSAIAERSDGDFFYLLVSNFALSSTTVEEVRMHFPKGARVKIKHPRALCTAKGRVIIEIHNPMYIDFLGIEVPDGLTVEKIWEEASAALEKKDYVRAIHLLTRCVDEEGYKNKVEALSKRCQAWLGLNCYERAFEDAKRAHVVDSTHRHTYLLKGQLFLGLQKFRAALDSFYRSGLADDDTMKRCARLIEQRDTGNYELREFILGKSKAPEVGDYLGPVRMGMAADEEKGRGLFATEEIKAGQLLLVWNAAAVAPREDLPAKLMRKCLTSRKSLFQFLGLDSELAMEMGLFKPTNVLIHDQQQDYIWFDAVPAIAKLCSSYAFQIEDKPESPMGLWTLPALINHSCVPNVSQQMVGTALFVRAARNIRAEEELTLPYMDVKKPLDERMYWTDSRWGFTCKCLRCRVEARLHAQRPEFPCFHARMREAAKRKDRAEALEELRRIAVEVEDQIATLASPVERDWVRTSYYSAYRAGFLERSSDSPAKLSSRVSAYQMMAALHATCPGYGIVREMVALAKSALPSPGMEAISEKSRSLIEKECLCVLGEQKREFLDVFVDELLKGADFDILRT